ncbi:hypothetical protein OTK49_21055 [Vibrio coralliirubri]|nr:hypothetical protein [Vibrio coralliirubri]MCY9865009.1 hypothetical protein [Vibrio coralliirubri]
MFKKLLNDFSNFYSWVFDKMDGQFHLDDIDTQLIAAFILAVFY